MNSLENLLSTAYKLYDLANPAKPHCEEYDQVLKLLERILKVNPKEKKAYSLRWHIRFLRGDLSGALKDLNEAINIAPENAPALYNRGYLYEHLNKYPEAEDDFRAALEIAKRRNNENLIHTIEHHIDIYFEN